MARRRLRNLALVDLAVLALSVPGILNVVAKDHVTTAEGVWAWVSAIAFVIAVLGLLALAVVALGRAAAGRG